MYGRNETWPVVSAMPMHPPSNRCTKPLSSCWIFCLTPPTRKSKDGKEQNLKEKISGWCSCFFGRNVKVSSEVQLYLNPVGKLLEKFYHILRGFLINREDNDWEEYPNVPIEGGRRNFWKGIWYMRWDHREGKREVKWSSESSCSGFASLCFLR